MWPYAKNKNINNGSFRGGGKTAGGGGKAGGGDGGDGGGGGLARQSWYKTLAAMRHTLHDLGSAHVPFLASTRKLDLEHGGGLSGLFLPSAPLFPCVVTTPARVPGHAP